MPQNRRGFSQGCREKLALLWALDELFELPLLIYHIVIIHNNKFIHNLIDNKIPTTTKDSNTGFLCENPIRKGNSPHFAWEISSALNSHPCC